ncbi:hypothetical protein AAMO2058_000283500 [Amorphochlora amoebiformis]
MRRRRRKQGGCWSVEEEGNIQSVNSSRRQSSRNHSSADRKDPPHLRFIRVFIENLARKSSNDFISVVAREIVKVKCYKGRYSEKPKPNFLQRSSNLVVKAKKIGILVDFTSIISSYLVLT